MAEMISVTIQGQDELLKYCNYLFTKNRPALMRTMTDACITLVDAVKKPPIPVNTGRLRSSITHTVSGKQTLIDEPIVGRVGTNVKYAPYLEFGTKKHLAPVGAWAGRHGFPKGTKYLWVSGRARPFIGPAFESNFDRIRKSFEKAVEDTIKK